MISRLFTLILFGTFLHSCSPDPRWGPPRNGLREPMEWQYRDSNSRTSISCDDPETIRSELAVEFVAYWPGSVPAVEVCDKKVRLVNGRAVAPTAIKRAV